MKFESLVQKKLGKSIFPNLIFSSFLSKTNFNWKFAWWFTMTFEKFMPNLSESILPILIKTTFSSMIVPKLVGRIHLCKHEKVEGLQLTIRFMVKLRNVSNFVGIPFQWFNFTLLVGNVISICMKIAAKINQVFTKCVCELYFLMRKLWSVILRPHLIR